MMIPVVNNQLPPIDLNGKSLLITGGTGSFGQSFVKHVIQEFVPSRLIVFSRDELKQHEMAQIISPRQFPFMRYFIGDVRERDRLQMAMRNVDYVIHAAAMKQVPTAEYNPFECIHTNVFGAENVVQASINAGVKRVIALSTDKATSPINLYGASKLASDKIFVAANNLSGPDGPRFSVARYGNVIGSRGSVVPLFLKAVKDGAKFLPITDQRMTRFWIALDQSVRFVLSSMDFMRGGEIFIPKIPSMKITDLANAIAPGIPHRAIGIRPGEKLHETLITEDDARTTLEFADRFIIEPAFEWGYRQPFPENQMKRAPEGFSYSSNTCPERLGQEDIRRLIENIGS